MDFWNRKKVAGLESEIERLQSDRESLLKQIAELKSRISGDRVCGGYCQKCKHGFQTDGIEYLGIGAYQKPWCCLLDCKCRDFEAK